MSIRPLFAGYALVRALGRALRNTVIASGMTAAGTVLLAGSADAWSDIDPLDHLLDPHVVRGVHILDGSYVMTAGELQVNITNFGLIGSRYSEVSTFSHAPSAQWPTGSGIEYLWAAGIWIGALKIGTPHVTTGQFEAELRPGSEVEDTIYEAFDGELIRPRFGINVGGGVRRFSPGADDDDDGAVDEDELDGIDNDGDGDIDEDFGQIARQMMTCRLRDDLLLTRELYPDHEPLDLEVIQSVYGWDSPFTEDFIALEYKIRNVGVTTLEDVYIGFLVDGDVGPRSDYDAGHNDLVGSWQGVVRSEEGTYWPVSIAYMRDGVDPPTAPGWIGLAVLDHPVDKIDDSAPFRVGIHSFHQFSSTEPFERGGDPTNDAERYQVLADGRRDPDTDPTLARDLRFLVSSGPFAQLEPGEVITYRVALVVEEGLEEMVSVVAEAARALFGQWHDADRFSNTGIQGRETKICAEDYSNIWSSPANPIYQMHSDFFDNSCKPPFTLPNITPGDLTLDSEGRHCIYVNADICDECLRRSGRICSAFHLGYYWNCNRWWLPARYRLGCSGILARETNLPWTVEIQPPPPPHLRVWARDESVHIYWDDRSEHVPDPQTGILDFEAYWIWRADNWDRPLGSSIETGPSHETWSLVAQYDLVNQFRTIIPIPGQPDEIRMLDFGHNTGLDTVLYRPRILDDPAHASLTDLMVAFVLADSSGEYDTFPSLRDARGRIRPGLEPFVPWETRPDVLDTFFAVCERPGDLDLGIEPKRSVRFYEHVDPDIHNGFIYFYSVTASDMVMDLSGSEPVITGEGYIGRPHTSFAAATPGFAAQDRDAWTQRDEKVFVYPNPATRASLEEFQQLNPNQDDPTGVRIAFAGLPAARNTIRIFTLAGDHVATVEHDGQEGYGQAHWNLVSRNGQQVASGIYLFSVESDDPAFEPFVGKFVIIW